MPTRTRYFIIWSVVRERRRASADFMDVLVVETNLNRSTAPAYNGKTEVFVDRIPAMPDGISRSADGGFWIGGVVRLSPLPRLLAPIQTADLVSHIVGPLLPVVAARGLVQGRFYRKAGGRLVCL